MPAGLCLSNVKYTDVYFQRPRYASITYKLKKPYHSPKKLYKFCKYPRFDPENWNFPPVQWKNNCYNYATQRQTHHFSQPGMYRSVTAQCYGSSASPAAVSPLPPAPKSRLIIYPFKSAGFFFCDLTAVCHGLLFLLLSLVGFSKTRLYKYTENFTTQK